MANHKSAMKRIRRNGNRNEIMGNRRTRIRSFVKQAEASIEAGEKSVSLEAFKKAESEIMRGACRGALHKKTASRKVSRLAAKLKSASK